MGKPVNQGGVKKANVKPPLDVSAKPSNSAKSATPGLGNNAPQIHTSGIGGTGTTHSSPKPFKK